MSHGVGVTEALQGLPAPVVLLFAALTQLGDLWFYFLWLTAAYAYGHALPRIGRGFDRGRAAFVTALAVGGYALTQSLKVIFAHPRPPGAATAPEIGWLPAALVPIVAEAATADGFSLPSGHAIGSTVVYGGLALVVDRARRRVGYLTAGVVAVVAVSRVVLGVHFLTDVVLGVLVGGAFLYLAYSYADLGTHPTKAFGLAAVVAAPGVVVHTSPDTVGALGAALGGVVGWLLVGDRVTGAIEPGEPRLALALGLPVGGALLGVGYALDSLVVSFLGFGAAILAVFAAPLAARRLVGGGDAKASPAD